MPALRSAILAVVAAALAGAAAHAQEPFYKGKRLTILVNHAVAADALDATVDTPDGDGETLAATLGGEDDRFEYVEDRDAVASSLGELTTRERKVLELRFGSEMTQSEIAEQIGVSQMQVSRILRRTLERLRTLADAQPT